MTTPFGLVVFGAQRYAPAVDTLLDKCYVGGSWIGSSSGDTADVTNPANGARIGTVPLLTRSDVDGAIKAAADAFPHWSARPAVEQAQHLSKAAQILRSEAEEIAFLITTEQGKPLREARGEVLYCS
jgi:succinate-semialdehyde dehydrogenase/glutarate-semialdehyde dehydrogenase